MICSANTADENWNKTSKSKGIVRIKIFIFTSFKMVYLIFRIQKRPFLFAFVILDKMYSKKFRIHCKNRSRQWQSYYNACNCLSDVVSVKKEQKCYWMVKRMIMYIRCLIIKINTVLSLRSLRHEFCTGYNMTAIAVTTQYPINLIYTRQEPLKQIVKLSL